MAQYHRHFPRNKIPLPVTLEAWLLLLSIVAAVALLKTDLLPQLLSQLSEYGLAISFITGLLFSSGIVTPLAIVAIFESAGRLPLWEISIVGALGAVAGDLLLFRFVRSQLVEYCLATMLHPRIRKFGRKVAASPFWWLGPIAGAIIIASPLPDELGLVMMGMSSIKLRWFVLLAFVANVIGIGLIVLSVPVFN